MNVAPRSPSHDSIDGLGGASNAGPPMAFLRSCLRRQHVKTRTDHELERALKIVTRLFPDWDVEALREVVTTGPDRAHEDTDHAAHLRRIEKEFVEYGPDRCRRVKYEALLKELESATRRKPSEGIHATVWQCLRDFEPRASYAQLFVQKTWNLLWGDLGTNEPGAPNSNTAERALGERGRDVVTRLLFDADFRGPGRPLAQVDPEIIEQIQALWPDVKAELNAARRALREDPDRPALRRLIARHCPELSTAQQGALRRRLSAVEGQRLRSINSSVDLILSKRFKIAARRVLAARSRRSSS